MRTSGAAGCCQSVEDVRKQRPAKGYSCELPIALSWDKTFIDELTVNLTEVLQGVHNMEIPSSPERVAVVGGDDV